MKEYGHLLNLFLEHLESFNKQLTRRSPSELYKPCSYILSLGGKRVRPLMALVGCDLFGKEPKDALDAALAVELFHNFSLIHDDILDKAPIRRGKPTVHVKWNTNIAILSGDVMLVDALHILENYSTSSHKKLTRLFTRTATEVCEGQQMDMNFETARSVKTTQYIEMIALKTAVLLGCSLQMGAMCAGAGSRDQQHLYDFGKNTGIAFQLMDDYLDAFSDSTSKFGKQIGGDIIANKKTFLLLKAQELANKSQKEKLQKLMLLGEKQSSKKISGVLSLFKELGVDSLLLKEAHKYTDLAIASLNKVKAPVAKKEALKQFALELVQRDS